MCETGMREKFNVLFPVRCSMCYSLYKIGKNKRFGHGPQGLVNNQYGSQPNEMSSNAITHNASYKQATSPSAYTEECQQTMYEHIQLQ